VKPPELEDLQHVDEVDAGGHDDQAQADEHQRPAGVEVALVVAVGDEPQRQRKPGEHQRPRVQVGDRAPAAEADARHAVVEVLAVGAVDRLAVLQPLEHHEGRVQERHGEQDQGQHERHHRRGLDGGLDRDHTHQQTQQLRAAVAHEARRGREVVEQEAECRAGRQRREHARLLATEVERDDRHRRRDDRADACRQAVHAVGEVDHVHHRYERHHGQQRSGVRHARVGKREFADERERDRLDRHAEVHDDRRRQHLPEQLDGGGQVEAIVQRAHRRDDRRCDQHPVPELVLVFLAVDVADGQEDQDGDERAREDRKAAQKRRGALREAPLTGLVDRAHTPREHFRERRQHRGHRRRYEKGVKRVELVRMRHRLPHSIAGGEVNSLAGG